MSTFEPLCRRGGTVATFLGIFGSVVACASNAPRIDGTFLDDDAFRVTVAAREIPLSNEGPTALGASRTADLVVLLTPIDEARGTSQLTLIRLAPGPDGAVAARRLAVVPRPVYRDRSLPGHNDVTMSGDGSRLLVATESTIEVWSVRPDAATPLTLSATVAAKERVQAVAISDDGSHFLVNHGVEIDVWHVADGSTAPVALGVIEGTQGWTTALGFFVRPDGSAIAITSRSGAQPIAWHFRMPPAPQPDATRPAIAARATPLEGIDQGGYASRVVFSRDGTVAAIHGSDDGHLVYFDAQGPTRVEHVGDFAGEERDALARGEFASAAFDATGAQLVTMGSHRGTVWRIEQRGPPTRLHAFEVEGYTYTVRFADDGIRDLTAERGPNPYATLFAVPASAWRPRVVRVGADLVRWESPRDPKRWSRLAATRLADTRAGQTRLAVRNDGVDAAYHVVGAISVVAPHAPTTATETHIHFGTIGPGETVVRTLPALAHAEEHYVDVQISSDDVPAPPRVAWAVLPQRDHDAGAIDHHAEQVFAAARDAMRELLGDPAFLPSLQRLDPDGVGFRTNGTTVKYQNPYTMDAQVRALNRSVIVPETEAEFLPEMELMLGIYIPHEMTHAARHHLGHTDNNWREEYIANLGMAVLMERVVALDASHAYAVATFHQAYDRYVARLGARITPEARAMVERFIASDGMEVPPTSPHDMFGSDVALYVYVGVRVAQYAIQTRLTPAQFRARFLVPAPKETESR